MKNICIFIVLAMIIALPGNLMAEDGSKDKIIYAQDELIKVWDPAASIADDDLLTLGQVYEGLTYYDHTSGKPVPKLAEKWEKSKDGLTWTFYLRKGVKFHDGEPFTAKAVKASVERTKRLGQGASFIWNSVKEIKVVDDHIVQFVLATPSPIDLISAAAFSSWIYSAKAAENDSEWFNKGHEAGTGPYKLESFEPDQQTVLVKFDDYWGGWDGPHFSRVVMKQVAEQSTQLQMIRGGEVDIALNVPDDSFDALRKDPNVKLLYEPSWAALMISINVGKSPTDNLKIRKALNYAFDYDTYINNIRNGLVQKSHNAYAFQLFGYNPDATKYEFNLEKAKQLVAESGIPKEKLKVDIMVSPGPVNNAMTQLFQTNLARIGVQLEITPGPWTVNANKMRDLSTAANMFLFSWSPAYGSPMDNMFSLFKSQDPIEFNFSHYSNPEVDTLLERAFTQEGLDLEKSAEAYAAAQKILSDDAAAIFIGTLKMGFVHRTSIKGAFLCPAYPAAAFAYDLYRQ